MRNTAKISDSAVSACSPPDSSVIVAGFLPGGRGDDLEPGLQRIVAFDELQFRRAAVEQRREQLLEVLVDRLERLGQPLRAPRG